jgi:hypothetical protein
LVEAHTTEGPLALCIPILAIPCTFTNYHKEFQREFQWQNERYLSIRNSKTGSHW